MKLGDFPVLIEAIELRRALDGRQVAPTHTLRALPVTKSRCIRLCTDAEGVLCDLKNYKLGEVMLSDEVENLHLMRNQEAFEVVCAASRVARNALLSYYGVRGEAVEEVLGALLSEAALEPVEERICPSL